MFQIPPLIYREAILYAIQKRRFILLHDIASGSDIKPGNKTEKTLVVYRFSNAM